MIEGRKALCSVCGEDITVTYAHTKRMVIKCINDCSKPKLPKFEAMTDTSIDALLGRVKTKVR
jgi:5-keto 4-deoxyuronate isomerase